MRNVSYIANLPSILSESAAIESEMGTQAYWNDEAKQARYRELQTQKGEVTAPAGDDGGGEVLEVFGPAEYAAEHGTTAGYNTYLDASRGAADVLLGMGASDRLRSHPASRACLMMWRGPASMNCCRADQRWTGRMMTT
ncbi:hypothetical protein [Rhizorhapis sp. SPR117]|uniref:hypothetical protein n=1 Tax=Rhizorhapis sp. SPR117 TaxID=2912611 RepID=UPI001F19DC66|nr:hypothetical protein [Rhizorhapis sp. SPR117]